MWNRVLSLAPNFKNITSSLGLADTRVIYSGGCRIMSSSEHNNEVAFASSEPPAVVGTARLCVVVSRGPVLPFLPVVWRDRHDGNLSLKASSGVAETESSAASSPGWREKVVFFNTAGGKNACVGCCFSSPGYVLFPQIYRSRDNPRSQFEVPRLEMLYTRCNPLASLLSSPLDRYAPATNRGNPPPQPSYKLCSLFWCSMGQFELWSRLRSSIAARRALRPRHARVAAMDERERLDRFDRPLEHKKEEHSSSSYDAWEEDFDDGLRERIQWAREQNWRGGCNIHIGVSILTLPIVIGNYPGCDTFGKRT